MELHLLHLLRGLPEEEIGAERGAEHGDDHRCGAGIEGQRRPQQRAPRRCPGHTGDQHHADIGKQREGEPFQQADIAMIGHEQLQQQRNQRQRAGLRQGGHAGDQLRGGAHGGEIGGDVEDVGGQQQQHQQRRDRPWQHAGQIAGEALARHPRDAGADQLETGHEGQGEHHRPQQAKAESGAGLRIGGDAGGIIIGCARHQPRPQRRAPARMPQAAAPVRPGRGHAPGGLMAGGGSALPASRRRPAGLRYRARWPGSCRARRRPSANPGRTGASGSCRAWR